MIREYIRNQEAEGQPPGSTEPVALTATFRWPPEPGSRQRPQRAASSGPKPKAPGFAGGYLLAEGEDCRPILGERLVIKRPQVASPAHRLQEECSTHAVCVQARFAGRYKICSAPRPMNPNHSQQIVEPSRELPGFQPYSSRFDPKKSSLQLKEATCQLPRGDVDFSQKSMDPLPRKAISSVPKLANRTPFAVVIDPFLVRAANYVIGHRDR